MAIWMDMTNSMQVWGGGVVGIVRAELEIARNLKKCNPGVRFCKYDGARFAELPEKELAWLWDSESVGDAYLRAMGRAQTAGAPQDVVRTLREQYPGLENAYRYSSSRLLRGVQGGMLYAETLPRALDRAAKAAIWGGSWPLRFLSLQRAHYKARRPVPKETTLFSHPFQEGDTVFSCGWMYSGKEKGFERVRQQLENFFLVYLVYDIILIRENTKQFYDKTHVEAFRDYIHWISFHCDAILCGGRTAVRDLQAYQKQRHLPCRAAYPVYFGSDIVREGRSEGKAVVQGRYIMAVGSIDARKNYGTLYRAVTILAQRNAEACPRLVIVGKGDGAKELVDTMRRDPATADKILLLSPTDAQLDWLYRNAAFVLLASAWEGWSLTLPEAMQYHKLVLASDVPPLREIGQGYVEYVDPFDPFAWAERIGYYCRHPEKVAEKERALRGYRPIIWRDCGAQVNEYLTRFADRHTAAGPSLYMDITLLYCSALYGGKITGILRTELMLVRHLYRQYDRLRFFALNETEGYIPVDVSVVAPVITGDALEDDYRKVCATIRQTHAMPMAHARQKQQTRSAARWLLVSTLPADWQKKAIAMHKRRNKAPLDNTALYDVPFRAGDVVFTAGTGAGANSYGWLLRTKAARNYRYCPVIYDLTPLLLPQVHQPETVAQYKPFIEFTSKMADLILYGGATAQRDGLDCQKQLGLPQPPSCAIRFGSDIGERTVPPEKSAPATKALKELGIHDPFVLAVGTMEARKNHETLYRAYLRMMELYKDVPQLVFAGHPGWKTADFIATLERDERVKGKIIFCSPTDEQLEALYRHCEFTVLASLYEGWSLTLPESYWYGKFCLCCDTPALREIAGDLAEYIHHWDEKRWAERIHHFHTHPQERLKKETAIRQNWHPVTWAECAGNILAVLRQQMEKGTQRDKTTN